MSTLIHEHIMVMLLYYTNTPLITMLHHMVMYHRNSIHEHVIP